jgi:hypothetical protein
VPPPASAASVVVLPWHIVSAFDVRLVVIVGQVVITPPSFGVPANNRRKYKEDYT